MLGQNGDNVLIKRLACCTRLLAAIEYGDGLDGRGQRGDEGRGVEGPIKPNLQQANLLALLDQAIDGFFSRFRARTHDDDDPLRIGAP